MKQIVQNFKTGEMRLEDIPSPVIKGNGILVRSFYSLISAGTEKMIIDLAKKSYLGKAQERPDLVKQVINKVKNEGLINTYKSVMNKIETPIPLGYSCVGQVVEVSSKIDDVKVGDFVACAGAGYANHAEINYVPQNLFVKIRNVEKLQELAFTTLGSIAMQGIRQAEVAFGEYVAVVGLGLLGQITAQILKAAGCRVIGFEFDPLKIDLAMKNGMDAGVVLGKEEPVKKVNDFTDGYGVDKIVITASTKENAPVELAADIARDRATVVMVGVTGMDLPRKPYYDKELNFKFSRSYGPGRYDYQYEEKGNDYPIGYIRWTERRNMQEFVRLVEEGLVNIEPLITHVFTFEKALEAYSMITDNPNKERFIGVLLKYDADKNIESKVAITNSKKNMENSPIKVGLIGAGNFTQSVLMPEFSKISDIDLVGVASAQGMHAKNIADKYGFKYAAGNYKEILDDKNVNLAVITSTHNLHYTMVEESILKGKDVYVEKPLCIKEEELEAIKELIKSHPERSLMVGFNRRFSKHVQEIKKLFSANSSPYMITYRVNAGNIPKGHWINDPEVGGGRIIGEVCHFVDLVQYIVGSKPVQVYTQKMSDSKNDIINEDNIVTTMSFEDGSVANILYSSVGDKSYPKEKIEIFSNGMVVSCENFLKTTIWNGGKVNKVKTSGMDKGFYLLYSKYIDYLRGKSDIPITMDEIFLNTLATFKVKESLIKNEPVRI